MKWTAPRIYHLASTAIRKEGLQDYLDDIGAPEWETNAPSDGELLMEVAGKGCYRSFKADLNPNLTKVRVKDNRGYLGKSIIGNKHGSVLEHVHDTFMFVGVSRVFTHELVRHRLSNFSQESLRFVRLTELEAYFPSTFQESFLKGVDQHLQEEGKPSLGTNESLLREKMEEVFEYLEQVQLDLANDLRLDDLEAFADKKKLTSALRRMAPIGLATAVMCTTNQRNWRHMIEQRTSRHAEEEIRRVFDEVFFKLSSRYPNVYQDAIIEEVDGLPEITFKMSKI